MPLQDPYNQYRNPAPYYGGWSPGADLFFVDGDFTQCDPCGMPVISYPMRGDSILALNDVIFFNPQTSQYEAIQLGTYPNIHPFNTNQQVIVVEQEFIVAQNSYQPMPLNTPYNVAWCLGFQNQFESGYPAASIGLTYLVEEGELVDIGGGLCKIRRKWATLPPTRCEIEQFAMTFPGLTYTAPNGSGINRLQYTQNVQSRIQYDYYIFDDLEILDLDLFIDGFGGQRLNAATGLYPPGLILQAMLYFQDSNIISGGGGVFIGNTDIGTGGLTDNGTVPSATEYIQWATGQSTSNGQTAELIAESSTMTRWMGNIWERRTRFVLAQ